MSFGGDKNPNTWIDLVPSFAIGIALFVFGIWAVMERYFFRFSIGNDLIDLGEHHAIIGLAAISVGVGYLFIVIKSYSKNNK